MACDFASLSRHRVMDSTASSDDDLEITGVAERGKEAKAPSSSQSSHAQLRMMLISH